MNKIHDILEEKRLLSNLLAGFYICRACGIVDSDMDRMTVGYPCPNCKVNGKGGEHYFPMHVHSLIDLIQEMYHAPSARLHPTGFNNHHLAVVVFFCTLGEVLLEWFLDQMLLAMRIPPAVEDRLLNDNRYLEARTGKLFPSVTGVKWNDTLDKISQKHNQDYRKAMDFFLQMAKRRNKLLHAGNQWGIGHEDAKDCILQMEQIIGLFVHLHNEFIPDIIASMKTPVNF